MNKSTNINRNNRWFSISLIIALTLALLTVAQASLNAQPVNEQDELEAVLLYDIEQWLDDAPLSFEEKTKEEIEQGMHKKAKELKALEARLQAQIEWLERLEGFLPEEKKKVRKEDITVFPRVSLKE